MALSSAFTGAKQEQTARQKRLALGACKVSGGRDSAEQNKEIYECPPEFLFVAGSHQGKTSVLLI
jgi:hypothetical protein